MIPEDIYSEYEEYDFPITDGTRITEVWTHDRTLKTRLYELCLKHPDEFILTEDEFNGGRLLFLIPEEELEKGV